MARIAAASEACGLVHCAIYTSRGEAAAPHLGSPLPQVYSQLYHDIILIVQSLSSPTITLPGNTSALSAMTITVGSPYSLKTPSFLKCSSMFLYIRVSVYGPLSINIYGGIEILVPRQV